MKYIASLSGSGGIALPESGTGSIICFMVKSVTKIWGAKAAKAPGVKVLFKTKDGVRIRKPKWKATHFTDKEIREAVASDRAAKRD